MSEQATRIQAGYVWRDGYRVPAGLDADAAGAEIERAALGRDGVNLRDLVEQARGPRSALHAALTTDPEQMADKLHLIEVREMAGALHYRIVNPQTEDEEIGPRAFEPGDTPNVWRKVQIQFVAPKEREASPPTVIRIGPVQAHPVAPRQEEPAALPPPPAAPAALLILTERQHRFAEQFRRMADAVADDPYFADVVESVRALR